MPKTLSDLHVESGLPTSDHMNGGNFSLHGKTHFTNTSTTPRDDIRVVWLFNCFLFLILFLSCRGGEGGKRLRVSLRTYCTLTNILHSPVSLALYGAPLARYSTKMCLTFSVLFFSARTNSTYAFVKTRVLISI